MITPIPAAVVPSTRFSLRPMVRGLRVASCVIPTVFVTHLALLTIPWLEFSWAVVGVHAACVGLVGFGVTLGYHRYFSHRAFKTSRVGQFVLGWLACLSTQRGPLWWAAHHRRHHAHSDQEHDVHSPRQRGLLYAHIGWLFDPDSLDADYRTVRDFTKYPELVALDWLWWVPPLTMVGLTYWVGGWPAVVIGYLLAVVTVKHVTFAVNSIGHVHGPQSYDTRDTSRNNWVLGYLALGDGWHNNHHYSPRTARHGFKWFELDASYWLILLLEQLGLVWDVKKTPRPPRGSRTAGHDFDPEGVANPESPHRPSSIRHRPALWNTLIGSISLGVVGSGSWSR